MNTNQTLLGVQSPGEELEIRDFQRIKRVGETAIGLFDGTAGPVLTESQEVFIDAWSGKIGEGLPVHVAYRFGEMTIEIDLPTPRGGRQPLTVLRWKPRLALGMIAYHSDLREQPDAVTRKERADLAERSAELAEIRALNGKERLLSEGELRGWLAERNLRFDLLYSRGLAGGKFRFRLARPESNRTAAA
jgi:hypothetical protein